MSNTTSPRAAALGRFPSLLYWADLPVSPTSAGATLLHRLLEAWPAEKLLVVTPNAVKNCALPGVRTCKPPRSKLARLYRTRFGKMLMSMQTLQRIGMLKATGGHPPVWLRKSIDEFRPEAILTVGIAGAWIPAAALAKFLSIPMHVIVHDDHHYAYFWIPQLRNFGENLFGSVYRQAVSRLCISKPMEHAYVRRFGVSGEVLLPSRGRESVFFREPPPRVAHPLKSAQVFYAGSVYGKGFEVLDEIALALRTKGHRLIAYTPSRPSADFRPRALEIRAALPSAELVKTLHEEADMLLLLTSFAEASRRQVETLFPSKMVDYAAAAVPVVVAAPEYACIVNYLQQRPTAGHLLLSDRGSDVLAAVEKLAADPARRHAFAQGAVAAGLEDFSYENAWDQFTAAMRRKRRESEPL